MEFSSAEKNSISGFTPSTEGQPFQRVLMPRQRTTVDEDVEPGIFALDHDIH